MKNKYLIALEPGSDKIAWGVVVPDLPGCFSASDSLAEAIANAPEAIELWLEGEEHQTQYLPPEKHINNPEFEGWLWALVEADYEYKGRTTSEERLKELGITTVNAMHYLNTEESCAAYLREVAKSEDEFTNQQLLEIVSYIQFSKGYQDWAAREGKGSCMVIGEHEAVICFDDELGQFRGEFIDLNGGADFFADNVKKLRLEGRKSLSIYLADCRREGIKP